MIGIIYSDLKVLHRLLYVLILVSFALPSISQEVDTSGTLGLENLSLSKELGNINVTINPGDSIDLNAIDSILTALDTLLNKLEPDPEIYGHKILQNDSIKIFLPSTIAKVPDSYTLSSGDEIAISIFGTSQYEGIFTVDTMGFIKPSQLPKILLKGLSWGDAKSKIMRRFSSYFIFRSEQFAASLTTPREITVNIFGEVKNPGSYNFVATNTAFNAIIAAGGVTKDGSVRNIGIYNGSNYKALDIYELMINPGLQFGNYLEDNVLIQVPASKKIIKVVGAVKRPMKYELLENEDLLDLLDFAGGLNADAAREIVQIERFSNDEKILIDLGLSGIIDRKENYKLFDGDVIRIKSVENKLVNIASVEGAVEYPGNYSLGNTPKISDLLKKSVLKREARLDIGFLVRLNPDSTFKLVQLDLKSIIRNPASSENLTLESNDNLIVNSQISYAEKSTISVTGAVRKEIEYPFDPEATITLNQAILLAGGMIPEATEEGFIIRTNVNNRKEREYLKVNLRSALNEPLGPANIRLEPLDEVLVLESSKYSDVTSVTLRGAVREPITLQYAPSLSLKNLLILGGGLRPEASKKLDVYSIDLTSEGLSQTTTTTLTIDDQYNVVQGPSNFILRPYDEVVVRTVPDFNLHSIVTIEGEVSYPGEYALVNPNEKIVSLVKRAGGLTSEASPKGAIIYRQMNIRTDSLGFKVFSDSTNIVSISLDQALSNVSSSYNSILKDGDLIHIPRQENLIYIRIANTRAQDHYAENPMTDLIGVAFQPGKNAKWFIEQFAGGFSALADKKSVTVKYVNGSVSGTRGKGIFRKYPKVEKGGIITVETIYNYNELESSNLNANSNSYPNLKRGVIVNIGKGSEAEIDDPNDQNQ